MEALAVALPLLLLPLLLWPVMTGRYFADDWEFVFDHPGRHLLSAFAECHPYRLYRPVQLMAAAASRVVFGESTLPTHVANLGLHALLVVLCLHVLDALRVSRVAKWTAAGLLVVSQLNAAAIGGNDTLSLVLGTLAGSAAVWWTWDRAPARRPRRSVLAWAAYLLAILAKESSLGYLPVLCVLALRRSAGTGAGSGGGFARALGFLVLTVAYLAVRPLVGAVLPTLGQADSPFRLGSNLLVNPAMIAFAVTTPISTTNIYTGIVGHRWVWPAMGAVGAALVASIAAVGIVGRGGWRGALAVFLAGLCVLGPVLPLKHVSELYAYALLPVVAIGAGLGMHRLWPRGGKLVHASCVSIAALVLVSNGFALRSNSEGMARNGAAAARLMPALLREARALPARASLILVDPTTHLPDYSVYRMHSFRLAPQEEIQRLSGRTDLRIITTRWNDLPPARAGGEEILTFDGDFRLVRLERPLRAATGGPG